LFLDLKGALDLRQDKLILWLDQKQNPRLGCFLEYHQENFNYGNVRLKPFHNPAPAAYSLGYSPQEKYCKHSNAPANFTEWVSIKEISCLKTDLLEKSLLLPVVFLVQ
jgi:hypothetical protein